jgi:hypothetical protein
MKKMQVNKLALRKNTISNLSTRKLKGGGMTPVGCDTWGTTCPPTCNVSCGGTCLVTGCGGTTTTTETRRTCPV